MIRIVRRAGPLGFVPGILAGVLACLGAPYTHLPIRIIYNASPSIARGWYLIVPPRRLRVGMLVIAHIPPWAACLAADRDYLSITVPVIKRIAAASNPDVWPSPVMSALVHSSPTPAVVRCPPGMGAEYSIAVNSWAGRRTGLLRQPLPQSDHGARRYRSRDPALDVAMSRNLLIAGGLLASVFGLLGGEVLAADRPVSCGMTQWQSAIHEASALSGIPFA